MSDLDEEALHSAEMFMLLKTHDHNALQARDFNLKAGSQSSQYTVYTMPAKIRKSLCACKLQKGNILQV